MFWCPPLAQSSGSSQQLTSYPVLYLALLFQQLRATLETVCPSVCQSCYFQNLISAWSHSNTLDHVVISFTAAQRWTCKSPFHISLHANERVRHKYWSLFGACCSHQTDVWLLVLSSATNNLPWSSITVPQYALLLTEHVYEPSLQF